MSPFSQVLADHGKPLLTLANKITITRILLIPVIVIGLLEYQTTWVHVLLGLTMVSDLMDGLAARLRGERTALGAFLDPMADKLLLTSVFMVLTYRNVLEPWVFVVVFSRDLLIVLGWFVIYILTGSSKITPRWLGKLTTGTQMVTVFSYVVKVPAPLPSIFLWLTMAITVGSAIDYIIIGERRLGGWG